MNVLVEVNAAVRKLAELSSLLDLCKAGGLSAVWCFHSIDVCVCFPLRRGHSDVSSATLHLHRSIQIRTEIISSGLHSDRGVGYM